jgi:hypothetical protein
MARPKSGFLRGFGKAVEVFKAIADTVLSLGGSDADLERIITDGKLRTQIAQLIMGATTTVSGLLTKLTAVSVPAGRYFIFVAKDHFTKDSKVVDLYYFSDTFTDNFLGKTEHLAGVVNLRIHDLKKDSLDIPIINELGNTAETSLAHLWHLLTQQPIGEPGTLLTDGSWNIFYIRDVNGVLWTISVDWYHSHGWCLNARSVGNSDGWRAGRRVVSR